MKKYNRVLSIAGFDGSGGAGIQADLKTFTVLGCYGMTVLTSLPVQNTKGVFKIYDISPQCVAEQCEAIISDIGVDAVKIGMLQHSSIIETIASTLQKYSIKKIVLDPVMIATSGDPLISDEAIETLKSTLLPLASVITPNIPEAERLTGLKIATQQDMITAANLILQMGSASVVLKGGHLKSDKASDLFLDNTLEQHWLSKPWVQTKNTHGTGCTFSAAIAAYLSKNCDMLTAVTQAKEFLYEALLAGSDYQCGKGNGPVCHIFDNLSESGRAF